MDSVNVPFLPSSLWILAGAMTILILLVTFGLYVYWRRWAIDLTETGSDVASLKAKRLSLERDVEALREWITTSKSELERLGAEREDQERLRAVLANLEQQIAIKNQENQTLRNEVGELENQRHHLTQTLDRIQREIGDLEAKRAEKEAMESLLAQLRPQLEEARKTVQNLAAMRAMQNVLAGEKEALERAIESLRSATESARTDADRLRNDAAQARIQFEQIERELNGARKERAELDVIIDTLRQERQALENSVERLEDKLDPLKQEIEDLNESAREAQKEAEGYKLKAGRALAELERVEHQLASVQKERHLIDMQVGELNSRKATLENEIRRLEGRIAPGQGGDGRDPLRSYADLLEKQPLCLSKDAFKGKRDDEDEWVLLQRVKRTLRSEGLVFSSRIIDAFHTSLKCHDINPITVLAGVSGTGKTLLPVRYAEIIGMHRLVMAVQPRWDSPQDMFGFYNYLEKEYKATELSRALVRMDPYNYPETEFHGLQSRWVRDRLLLVLIDEMNLARTEYYFSEFLSRLELRRAVKDPSLATQRSEAEIELDAGPGKHRFRLWVDSNVFFVGTMNEDETTQTLSDKVLDRANVLRFGKPDEKVKAAMNGNAGMTASSEKYLSFGQWRKWQREFRENAEWHDSVSQWTSRLNSALNRVGRPFGYRVLQAIGHYVANYPRVEDDNRYKLAFADQVEQKIIPKIRGIDLSTDTANECLNEVEAIIADLGDRELSDAFSLARTESRITGMFQWRGVTRREEEDLARNAH